MKVHMHDNAGGSRSVRRPVIALLAGIAVIVGTPAVRADAGHGRDEAERGPAVEEMIEQHKEHEHGHDFEVMERMSPEDREQLMDELIELGLALPPMDSRRGRELFVDKGCVVCHSVNGVGGEIGPSMNAADMPSPMNAFEFAARMWRGAPAMAEMQEAVLGEMISLDGRDLADLVAFAHDEAAQKELRREQVPARYRELMGE